MLNEYLSSYKFTSAKTCPVNKTLLLCKYAVYSNKIDQFWYSIMNN